MQIWQGAWAVVGDVASSEAVRIGALPNVCSQFLPEVVQAFKWDFPNVRIQVTPGTNAGLLGALRRGETDLVIGRLSSSDDMRGLVFEALYDEPLVFVVRASHPLASRPATLRDVLGYPLLLPPEGTIIRQELSRFLAGQGVGALADIVESTSSDFQRAYISTTECVAAIPRGVVQDALAEGVFHDLAIGQGDLKGPVGLTTNPDLRPGKAVASFLQRVRARA